MVPKGIHSHPYKASIVPKWSTLKKRTHQGIVIIQTALGKIQHLEKHAACFLQRYLPSHKVEMSKKQWYEIYMCIRHMYHSHERLRNVFFLYYFLTIQSLYGESVSQVYPGLMVSGHLSPSCIMGNSINLAQEFLWVERHLTVLETGSFNISYIGCCLIQILPQVALARCIGKWHWFDGRVMEMHSQTHPLTSTLIPYQCHFYYLSKI